MYRQRVNYWSHSKLAKWLQSKVGQPHSKPMTSEGWVDWETQFAKEHPYVYWFTETFLDNLQDIVYYPKDLYRSVRSYVLNRFIDRMHCLTSDLKPGQYYDIDTRMLHSLFNTLVDFVEIEKASMNDWSTGKSHRALVWDSKSLSFKRWRSVEDGLKYLEWEMSLDNEYIDENGIPQGCKHQADTAREVLELYNWWKNRANRPDPYVVTGYHDFLEQARQDADSAGVRGLFAAMNHCDKDKRLQLSKLVSDMEQQYQQEDDEMLMRLVKIRRQLWT